MSVEMRMPQLGMMMVEGTVLRWLVADGARIAAGDEVVEIESDKVVQVITAPAAGVLRQVAAQGECVPVLQVLGEILTDDEARGDRGGEGQALAQPHTEPLPLPSSPLRTAGEVRASPIARRLAAEHGIDLATVVGTGPGGRVVEADVQAAIQRHASEPGLAAPPVLRRTPLTGRRGVIARRMMDSLAHSAQLTIVREIDARALLAARQTWNARAQQAGVTIRYDAILAKALAVALRKEPALNAVVEGDDIFVLAGVHVGIAMATPAGLAVPVVRDADRRELVDIARTIGDLAARAGQEQLTSDDLAGGTVTLSNMGIFEVDHFTPILNPPQSAILGVGRIADRPWVVEGELTVRPTMHLSLTWDHRVADGSEAGRLLACICALINDTEQLRSLAGEDMV